MTEGYFETAEGLHVFYDSKTGVKIIIDNALNEGTVSYVPENEYYTKSLLEEDTAAIIEFMKVPGTGLGMLLIKLGRAFERAVTGGSSAT